MAEPNKIDQQFGFVNNLFIGLAAGVLTFLVHLAFSDSYTFRHIANKVVILAATVSTFASILFGSILAWSRIEHFRLLARLKDVDLDRDREKVREWAGSELINRKFIRNQGLCLLLSAFLLFILAFSEFLQKGAG